MRLTLRTLLAWLDDTLPPAEVREIGKQVSESPFAQELVERIRRVNRQRRLTVPPTTGPEATDPNLVASYLDNELDQDLVPEYEKLCLTSDVHMAEVASVHQILSLVGQKAKVPQEAKNRMYHLIRGREVTAKRPRPEPVNDQVSEPMAPWVTPPPPIRPWIEQYGPAAGAFALFLVLSWSAWVSLREDTPPAAEVAGTAPAKAKAPAQAKAKGVVVAAAGAGKKAEEAAKAAAEPDATAVAKVGEMPAPAPETRETPKAETPSGMVGMTQKADGVLLRYNTERREWEQLVDPAPLKPQDMMLSLDPFRSTLVLGQSKTDLVGETQVLLLSTPPNEAARFQLVQGRVVLHGEAPALPFRIIFAGKPVLITPPAGSSVGVERLSRFEPGNPESAGSVLRIYGSEGDVPVAVEDARETLKSPGSIVWDGAKWTDASDRPAPSWVTDPKPSAFDAQVGEQFLKYIRPNRPVITNIVEALDDDQKDVRRLSLRALRAVGDLSYITPVLNKPDDPTSRREAIRVLRAALAQGPDAVKAVHDQLERDFGEQGKLIEKLLIGFSPKEARDDTVYSTLVQQLAANEVCVRELALDNLRGLTGRDDLQYDPDRPDGPGQRAWRDLLRTHELRPAAAVPKAEK